MAAVQTNNTNNSGASSSSSNSNHTAQSDGNSMGMSSLAQGFMNMAGNNANNSNSYNGNTNGMTSGASSGATGAAAMFKAAAMTMADRKQFTMSAPALSMKPILPSLPMYNPDTPEGMIENPYWDTTVPLSASAPSARRTKVDNSGDSTDNTPSVPRRRVVDKLPNKENEEHEIVPGVSIQDLPAINKTGYIATISLTLRRVKGVPVSPYSEKNAKAEVKGSSMKASSANAVKFGQGKYSEETGVDAWNVAKKL
eukprot:TRINITY_DN4064_c0_g1::TRINITY_DN4064_c0_g1_i1::g.11943::m.11943 TRINITY_DN4064_c0_g1::TRINITY_DN4064_c0_g1_i1::g.11943  ORF type:complete len:279 (-),score=49.12 TRINITY_DN4064_c0_g1_i1:98-859(-)